MRVPLDCRFTRVLPLGVVMACASASELPPYADTAVSTSASNLATPKADTALFQSAKTLGLAERLAAGKAKLNAKDFNDAWVYCESVSREALSGAAGDSALSGQAASHLAGALDCSRNAAGGRALELIRSRLITAGRALCEFANATVSTSDGVKLCTAKLAEIDEERKQRASLRALETAMRAGRRADIAATLGPLRDSRSPTVQREARELLRRAHGFEGLLQEQLHAPWFVSVLWASSLFVGIAVILRTARTSYRAIESKRTNHPVRWTLLPISQTPSVDAADVVLDALKRGPAEARRQTELMRSLLLRPIDYPDYDVDVWRDFLCSGTADLQSFDEDLKAISIFEGKQANDALADAFQNIQIALPGISTNIVARTLRAVVDWWHAGRPTLGGAATVTSPNDPKAGEVSIRLTCTGGPTAHVTVLASTVKEPGFDVVAFTAERAAFKLLYRLTKPSESVGTVDGVAAYRQGVALLDRALMPYAESDSEARRAMLTKAAIGLRFARQSLPRDSRLCCLTERYEGLVHALLGNRGLALELFEAVQDHSSEFAREAVYSQAVLHLGNDKALASGTELRLASQLAANLLLSEPVKDGVDLCAATVLVTALSRLSRQGWSQLNVDETDQWLDAAHGRLKAHAGLPEMLPADARHYRYLIREARGRYAVARFRQLSTIRFSGRLVLPNGIEGPIREQVATLVDYLLAFQRLDDPSTEMRIALAGGLLLSGKFADAKAFAAEVISADAQAEYASYLAAEASLCVGAVADAKSIVDRFNGVVTERALRELKETLAVAPVG